VATTLAELEKRLQTLEAEVASLRKELVNGSLPAEASAGGVVRRSQAQASPAAPGASLNAIYQEMGIAGEAPGIDKLRALLAAQGVHPGDEVVRQEIAAMRDQEEENGE
jgi:hypothetical protein